MSESNFQVPEHMHSLIAAFAEMMTGESTPEHIDILLQWSLYMHIRSVMPPLLSHWNQENPENAEKVKKAMKELQALNQHWKASRQQQPETE